MKKVSFNHRVGQVALALFRRPYLATSYAIAREIGVSQSYVSRVLKHMGDAGMVEYREFEHRRGVWKKGYRLTEMWSQKMAGNNGYLQLFSELKREAVEVKLHNEATSWL